MGQGFKVYSSSELYCKWPKVAETMTEAWKLTHILSISIAGLINLLVVKIDTEIYSNIESIASVFTD